MRDRILRAASPAALLTSVLAVVVAGAGIGWTAGQIGTSDLKDNAVTSPKIKNGTVSGADLSKQEKSRYVGDNGVDFSTGGEGDCLWTPYSAIYPTLEGPGYRIDREGIVHLTGEAIAQDGPGGDGSCGDEFDEDGVVFTLPKKYRPARAQIQVMGSSSVIVTGKDPVMAVPPGVVFVSDPSTGVVLSGISYPAAGTPLATKPRVATGAKVSHARALLRQVLRAGER